MKTNKKRKKYKRIDGVLYEAITSYYDGRVIGWGKVYFDKEQLKESIESKKTY